VFPDVNHVTQGEVEGNWFRRVHDTDRLFVRFGAGTSIDGDPILNRFSLGGPMRLGSFNADELRGPNYLLGTAGYLKGIGRLPDVLGGGMFLGGWFEQGTAFKDWSDAHYQSSVSVGGILETLLGPVFGGASVDFDGRCRFYVGIGPMFR
jgi:NTE family protein